MSGHFLRKLERSKKKNNKKRKIQKGSDTLDTLDIRAFYYKKWQYTRSRCPAHLTSHLDTSFQVVF